MSTTRVSVVIPCYRSSGTIGELTDRLVATCSSYALEVILIDDASPEDETWMQITSLAQRWPGIVRGFRLARNVGQHSALICAFAQVSADTDVVVTMDDDLQQLPEDVPALVAAVEAGADIAIGSFDDKRHARWRNAGGSIVDQSLRRIFDLPRDFALTSFRAFRRHAAEEAVENRSRYSYLTASLLSVTRKRVNVQVQHLPRREGRSGYSLLRSIELALNLYMSYSRAPLYLIFLLFLASISMTGAITLWTLHRYLDSNHIPMGWTSQMIMMGICSTLNLAATGVVALFAVRLHRTSSVSQGSWRISART